MHGWNVWLDMSITRYQIVELNRKMREHEIHKKWIAAQTELDCLEHDCQFCHFHRPICWRKWRRIYKASYTRKHQNTRESWWSLLARGREPSQFRIKKHCYHPKRVNFCHTFHLWHYLSQITMFSLCMFMSTSHWNHYMLHFSQSMAMDSSVGNSCIPSIILATWRLKARSFLGSFKPTEPWGVAKLHDAQGSRWCLKSLDQKNKNVGYTIWYNRNRIKYWIA